MRIQPTTEPTRQKIRVQRRGKRRSRHSPRPSHHATIFKRASPNGPTSSILNERLTTDMPLTIGYRLSGKSSVSSERAHSRANRSLHCLIAVA
jgi:hypothetical protein